MQALREVMPPVLKVEASVASSATRFPSPLAVAPLPSMIVTERGESLDEFCERCHPDFFTVIQVRRKTC